MTGDSEWFHWLSAPSPLRLNNRRLHIKETEIGVGAGAGAGAKG
jgi:hypothetical protein